MANTFELIYATTVGSGGATDITFSTIPSTYTDLCLKISARGNYSDIYTEGKLRFNGAGSDVNLSSRTILGQGSGTPASFSNSYLYAGPWVGNTATSNTFANIEIYIPNYASTSITKSMSIDAVGENNATGAYATLHAGLFNSTSAITSIQILPVQSANWMQYTTAYLYGVKNA